MAHLAKIHRGMPREFCAIQNSGLNNSIWVEFGCRARIYLPTLEENWICWHHNYYSLTTFT